MKSSAIAEMHRISQNIPDALATIYAHTHTTTFSQKRLLSNQFTGCRLLNLRPGLRLPRQRKAGDGSAGRTMARKIQFEKCL